MGEIQICDTEKDSHGVTIFKKLLVTVLCIGGMVFPIWCVSITRNI